MEFSVRCQNEAEEDSTHKFPQLMFSGVKKNGNKKELLHTWRFDSWIAKCPCLCHLFRSVLRPEIKENIHCHPAFIMRDINVCRESYSKGRLESRVWKNHHCCKSWVITHRFLSKPTTKYSAIFDDIKRYNLYHHTWRIYRIQRR